MSEETERQPKRHKKEERSSLLYYVVLGLVGLVLILSLVQTVQINALKEKIETGGVSTSVAAAPASQAQAPAPRPAPAMVGGC